MNEVIPENVAETATKDEIWDILEAYPSHTKNIKCMGMDGTCNNFSIAAWATNLEPEKKWFTCEDCQEIEFGGWPEGFDIPILDSDSVEEDLIDANESTDAYSNSKEKKTCDNKNDEGENDPTKVGSSCNEKISNNEQDKEKNITEEEIDTNDKKSVTKNNVDSNVEEHAASNDNHTDENNIEENCQIDDENSTTISSEKKTSIKNCPNGAIRSENKKTNNFNTKDQQSKCEDKDAISLSEDNEENEGEEQWLLSKILSLNDIQAQNPIMCDTDGCPLQACSKWICMGKTEEKPWMTCLDCQELDFEGWPPIEEIPQESLEMTLEHINAISECCTRQDKPALPPKKSNVPKIEEDVKTSSKVVSMKGEIDVRNTTPPSKTKSVNHLDNNSQLNRETIITPSPQINGINSNNRAKTKPSASAIAIHRKWQAAAEKMGGKDARIVVSKPVAKQLILELLTDSFRPMNITNIFQVSQFYTDIFGSYSNL